MFVLTRSFFFVSLGSFLVLLLFISLNTQLVTVTVPNPSLNAYNDLQVLYPNTLKCPCSAMTIPYQKFVSLSPTLHQVCSSDFVDDRWIAILKSSTTSWISIDWRNLAYTQFQLLSTLCQLANKTINDAVRHFLLESFIASSALTKNDFNTQLNATLNQFVQSTVLYFDLLVDTEHLLMQVDQPYTGSAYSFLHILNVSLIVKLTTNETTDQQSLQLTFRLTGTRDMNSTLVNCICAIDPNCESSVAIYDIDHGLSSNFDFSVAYIVPGSIIGCFKTDFVLLSTLECFYLGSHCFPILLNYIKEAYFSNIKYPSWFDVHPLIYDPKLSRYPPNTKIAKILNDIMIEQWNPSFSYKRFYELCAPSYCTYSHKVRTKTIVQVMVMLMSLAGGLTITLRLITPQLVKCAFRLLELSATRQQQQQQQVRPRWFVWLKVTMQNLIILFYTKLIGLNIFPLRDFGNNVDQMRARRFGQWATRLYIVLLGIGIAILALYTIVQPQTLTKTFNKPSLNLYNDLIRNYGDKLKCSCSLIASPYNRFVKMEPVFHEICSSPFVSDEWRINLTKGLVSDLSAYARKDYRRFLSGHLQFLSGLCQLSIRSVNNSIEQFLTSLLITTQLLPELAFHARLDLMIKQSQSNAPKLFTRFLFLIRNLNHGNAIISSYGTNFEYIVPWDKFDGTYAPTQAMIYDDECSCGLYLNCTSQANFIKTNSSEIIPVKGLKIGCTLSESLRASTLECFYNSPCINLIQQYTNYTSSINSTKSPTPLTGIMSRFLINTTVGELINNLFNEQWATTVNYSSYFEQCSPLLCSYTYTQQINSFYTVTLLLGLEGGLTIVLTWLCPKIVRIVAKVYRYRNQRRNIIQPARSLEVATIEIVNTNVHTSTPDAQSIPMNVTSQTNFSLSIRCSFKIILTYILLLLVLMGIIIFSIYFVRQENNQVDLTISSTSTTTGTGANTTTIRTASTSSTTAIPPRQLKFQPIAVYRDYCGLFFMLPVVADFNGDDRLDLTFFCNRTSSINVLLGNGNGTFKTQLMVSTRNGSQPRDFAVGDFNNDSQLDFVFTDRSAELVNIHLGAGNGTFRAVTALSTGYGSGPLGLTVADLNGDSYLDIAVANFYTNNVGIFFGNGNGTFSIQKTFWTGRNSFPMSVAVGDFNNDHYPDIAVVNEISRSIGIFLGHGDGTFEAQQTYFAVGRNYPWYLVIDDFNNDTQQDVVFSTSEGNTAGVLFGYGNGTLSAAAQFSIGIGNTGARIAVGDFNSDGHRDIVVGRTLPYGICVLLGYGNGNFDTQIIFSTELFDYHVGVAVGDFNGDGCQDIVATDGSAGTVDILLNTSGCCATEILETSTSIHQ